MTNSARYKYIDVLKAIAIVAVVFYHSGFLQFGYLGVDLFLVINGYLITKSLNKRLLSDQLSGGGRFELRVKSQEFGVEAKEYFGFEISRVMRLLPVLLVAGVVCMAVGYFMMLPDDYENLSQSVVASNFFGNNILAAITTKNYWDVVNEYKPLMHTWYVGIIMQFYLVYPLLFFLAKIDKNNPQRSLLTMVSALAVISLLVYFGITNTAHRFYYLPSRFFEFAVGGIVALTWKPQEGNQLFNKWFVYICYALLLALMSLNFECVEANIKLVIVVSLSVVMIMSSSILDNKLTANGTLAKVGAVSYSIFIWHQVLLAFYRYTISNHFTILSYLLFILAVAILSWLTYQFVEQKTNVWLKDVKSKSLFYCIIVTLFVLLTGYAGYIYKEGGVVRDVPELYISKNDKVDHKAYNDKIYNLNKPFHTNKRHWLVVGNSFGRDFANVILESTIANQVEVSYLPISSLKNPDYFERFTSAERVFLSSLGTDEETVTEVELVCMKCGFNTDQLVVVGTKNFGASNGQFYINREKPDYFEQRTMMEPGYLEINERLKNRYGERYLDLISLVIDEKETMPVFTPDHHLVSQDCRHFSKGGAIYFSKLIDWNKYMK